MAAREAGIRVCLGADWAPSGSKQLLGELKVAHLWNRHPQGLGGAFSDQELCEMVTAHPADALGWGDRIGRVRAGCFADLGPRPGSSRWPPARSRSASSPTTRAASRPPP